MSDRELIDLVDRALFPPEEDQEIHLDEDEFEDAREESGRPLR